MEITQSKMEKAIVLEITGRIDTEDAVRLDVSCDQVIQQGKANIVFDFTELEYLSSSGLRSILSVSKKLKPLKCQGVIVGARGKVQEIFDIAGFISLFPMCDTLEKAVRYMV